MSKITLAIGCDHAGFELKNSLISYLESDFSIKDFGTFSAESVDYPDFVHPVAKYVSDNLSDLGILICGSANGVAITANKYEKIRAAICWNEEVSALAKQHNNANIACLPARYISTSEAKKIISIFLSTEFEGGRHEKRVAKINIQP